MNKMNFIQKLLSKKVYEYDSGVNPKPVTVPEKKIVTKKPKVEMSQYEGQRRALERNHNKGIYSSGIGVGP